MIHRVPGLSGVRLLALVLSTAALVAPETLARDPVIFVNDQETRQCFLTAMTRHLDAGRTVGLEMLRGELGRRECAIILERPPARALAPGDLYLRLLRSVAVIGSLYQCDRCELWHTSLASGFVLSRSGAVVTSYHVVDRDRHETIGVMLQDGSVYPVKSVLAADAAADIAVLRIEGENLQPLPVRSDAPVGTRVFVLGHPDGQFFTFTDGMISRYLVHRAHEHDTAGGETVSVPRRERMAVTADFARGSSGAPVVDDHGALVGVVSSTRSVYYRREDGVDRDLQMVLRHCTTARALLSLVRQPRRAERL